MSYGIVASYGGSFFVFLCTFCKVYSIQMPQTHCKIINFTIIFMEIANLNKNIYRRVKFNRCTPIIFNGLLKWTYGLGLDSTLTFKCIFYYDFTSIFFIGIQYMIHDGGWKWIEKNYKKNFNQQITMNF
jgi:hypothetical protein